MPTPRRGSSADGAGELIVAGSSYDRVRALPLQIDGFDTERREAAVAADFTRVTTIVVLSGSGVTGRGEDVTYVAEQHDTFPALRDHGSTTLDAYSRALDDYGLGDYRRWAFESAALDLALRQNGSTLGAVLGRTYRPVRFVISPRVDIRRWLAHDPSLEFKLDAVSAWTPTVMREISATDRVRVVDLKGQYGGSWSPDLLDAQLYAALAEAFPEAVLEDPVWTDVTQPQLAGARDRISWDAPIHSADDIRERAPRHVNIKPSRFGSVRRLLDAIDYCEQQGIAMYGGGQFELDVGRAQIQALAALFYPDAANDVAPGVYNEGEPRPGLPRSPLDVRARAAL
jgi:L-alanine-DL-glutamate epimerase-like enolase superfamily enzyme